MITLDNFTDYTGDFEESIGIDSNGEFEIRVRVFPTPRDRWGELKKLRDTERYNREKRNADLIEEAIVAAKKVLGGMVVGETQELTDRASVKKLK